VRSDVSIASRYRRYLTQPARLLTSYRKSNLRPDLTAGLTVAVVAIPQSIAYAAIAGLPPAYGLYSACIATLTGALWGSSRFLSTGPTNALSILSLSVLAPLAAVGSAQYLLAASLLAVMVGVLCLVFGLAGLGMLVNFASRAVLLGFTGGAGILIAAGQLQHLLRLDVPRSPYLVLTLKGTWAQIHETHGVSLALGIGVIVATMTVNRIWQKLPGALIALAGAGGIIAFLGAHRLGVSVVGEVPRALPSLTPFSIDGLQDGKLVAVLVTGSLAVSALGLVEAISIAREIARQSGERLDVNQELVGQGVANIAAGLFSGYASSGSFTRSAVNFQAGARTQLSGVFGGLFVLAGVLAFGPFAAYLPKAGLAGLIMLVAYKMVDWEGVRRILRTSRAETGIMLATFGCTLAFPLEFAVLAGVILSLAIYIYQSSLPRVYQVVPDSTYRHFVEQADARACPQLAVMTIRGSLFFGAASHVEDELLRNFAEHRGQNLLLLRMHGVDRCDLSGIEVLESILKLYRQAGGDVFLVRVRRPVMEVMESSGFLDELGRGNILAQEEAIEYLFAEKLKPEVCTYECEKRIFAECQSLEKHPYDARLPSFWSRSHLELDRLTVHEFEDALKKNREHRVLIDVREPEEYATGHIPGAESLPLRLIIDRADSLPRDRPIYLVCRSGRRSARAMHWLQDLGFEDIHNLKGGILSWKALNRPLEVN
jgi:SulP family sulfate permease